MNVLVSGATGLIGSALLSSSLKSEFKFRRLTRSPRGADDIAWDPAQGTIDLSRLTGFDAVVHLAGESVAGVRWTARKKARIRDSRVFGTDLLCRALAELDRKPRLLVSASAIGFYGDRGEEVLDENAAAGKGFLAEVAQAWEAATEPAKAVGIRVVNLRFGLVLGSEGGALPQMLTPFRLGAGGRVGSGKQYVSWITLDDVVGAIGHALATDSLVGPTNTVAPHPVTNEEFATSLGAALGRPTLLPIPALALKLAMGEMSELLLASTRVIPRKLQQSGYRFCHALLDDALGHLLGKRNEA